MAREDDSSVADECETHRPNQKLDEPTTELQNVFLVLLLLFFFPNPFIQPGSDSEAKPSPRAYRHETAENNLTSNDLTPSATSLFLLQRFEQT
ncbi:hypothetical protein L1987_09836 [Smallanthus sonchifolius]|uniref:Uncharacterized protein n=1 Tax=Smallanthus sonchifolius TaxID=185202 RepID=A0ACB9JQE8_9ASTR|nr:hypothetical protein L1987_09836 [Smallanthus sonchifolius]